MEAATKTAQKGLKALLCHVSAYKITRWLQASLEPNKEAWIARGEGAISLAKKKLGFPTNDKPRKCNSMGRPPRGDRGYILAPVMAGDRGLGNGIWRDARTKEEGHGRGTWKRDMRSINVRGGIKLGITRAVSTALRARQRHDEGLEAMSAHVGHGDCMLCIAGGACWARLVVGDAAKLVRILVQISGAG
ncbi:hypothetical protein CDD82_3729 [Ophiocordyceps australis]|uniref:Uncharacterized protein n=1 Tax=Ophiocordyceps australis TaxID=1399860 RepID=A0A2C5ZC38_9HYPO|nr:hypothetical protein CDD82_3729 [Ophiocordyceps australis]